MDILYCYGNAKTLWSVYNGIALIFKDKTFFNALISISATIGLLWAMTITVFGGGIKVFTQKWFLPSFLIFNLTFLPTTTVHIVDCTNSDMKYAAIDHVPLGVAIFPCIASNISHVLTEAISQYLTPANSNGRFAATGDLFGAKFMTMAKDLRISSPQTRNNIKHFVNRCFTWPYVYANAQGLQESALASDDILGFIKSHSHAWCGSYWEDASGTTRFLSCKDGAKEAERILKSEQPLLAQSLSVAMFGASDT